MKTDRMACTLVLTILAVGVVGCGGKAPSPAVEPSVGLASATAASAVKPVPGPLQGGRLTEEYVKQVGHLAYLWAWPMVNVHNRRLILEKLPEPGLMGGIVPVAPINQLSMLRDYIEPGERLVACPNQDVVYGFGIFSLDQEPVVVQVPDFGDRFWVYQVVDQRTDSFAEIGKMYGSKPGFYMLVGPGWKGTTPAGITGTFQSKTNLGVIIPRAFLDDASADREAIQPALSHILMYPLSKFTGQQQTKDWSAVPKFPSTAQGDEEVKWVEPKPFFDELGDVLKEVPPLPGEEAIYQNVSNTLDAAKADPKLHAALVQAAIDADTNLVGPLFQFHNYGLPLPNHWTTQSNGAEFGTDYFTRAAVAKSNIFVNVPRETKYFYQDFDDKGEQLNGNHAYTVTFAKGSLPPVRGFWSLTLYNSHHFFAANDLKRYSLGTKNKSLITAPDGSVTIYVQFAAPDADKRANWLPAPKENIALYIRAYWPDESITNGTWTPPAVVKVK